MQDAKPAGGNGGHREIIIAGWKPLVKNTLRGFLSVNLPSGMLIHNVTVHEKGEGRWVSMPAREWVGLRRSRIKQKSGPARPLQWTKKQMEV